MHEAQPMNGIVTSTSRVLLRRLNQQQGSFQMQPPQQQVASLKCPRCDSLNTKFCYYNNYNLSQPRHFCKNCRRYWTKGGVLRNVPVGGGCRKSKRSSSSSKNNKSTSTSANTATNSMAVNSVKNTTNGQNSHSSSDSSSATPAVGGGSLFQIPEVENFGISSNDLLFSGEIEGFMGLITDQNKNNNDINGNDNGNVCTASFSEFLQSQGVQEWDMGKICGGVHQGEEKIAGDYLHQTDRIEDLLLNKGSNVALATLDWHLMAGNHNTSNNNQTSLFVVPNDSSTVDHHHHQGYWDQSTVDHHLDSQWSDSTTASHLPLFLP